MDHQELMKRLTDQLMSIGGSNPLKTFEASNFGQIDLARSHPGGLAQLTGSRSTNITNLVKDAIS